MPVPGLIGVFCPRDSRKRPAQELAHGISRIPDLEFSWTELDGCIALGRTTRMYTDASGHASFILHGELYNEDGKNELDYLSELYRCYENDFARHLNGSFAVLVVDHRNERVHIATDRVNSRRLFVTKEQGAHWVGASLYELPLANRQLDPAGLACYMIHGVYHNQRTLFEGVRVLDRACIHTLYVNGFRAQTYWTYGFDSIGSNTHSDLAGALEELLVTSVRRRLNSDTELHLSLSSGYDSLGLLGVLREKLGQHNLYSFSYVLGEPQPSHDAAIVARLSKMKGFEHRVLQSYHGNLHSVLAANATLGQGYAHFCEEIDMWQQFLPEIAPKPTAALFVGDECFGLRKDEHLTSIDDALHIAGIYHFAERVGWLRDLLPVAIRDGLEEAWEDDLQYIIKCMPTTNDYYNVKDYLYLDQRLQNVILPWRDFILGSRVPVRNPYLDNDILDFMQGAPSELRRGKKLYRETITAMFPDLFQFGRGTPGYSANWRREIINQSAAIEKLICNGDTLLDQALPGLLQQLFLLLVHDQYTVKDTRGLIAQWSRKIVKKLHKELRLQQPARVTPLVQPLDPTMLFLRLLVLQISLQEMVKQRTSLSNIRIA
jgi:hypothetical protein